MDEQDFYYSTIRGKLLGNKAREAIIEEFLSGLQAQDSLLEVGCSSGYYLKKLDGRCKRRVGVDVSKEKIEKAKKRVPEAEFYCIKEHSLPFKEKEFDWILCSEVLEHIPEYEKTLKEVKRVAKDKVLISIPVEDGIYWKTASKLGWGLESRGHVHMLSSQDIESKMNGFKLVNKKFVATPSRRINKYLLTDVKEKNSMYSVMLFEKKNQR